MHGNPGWRWRGIGNGRRGGRPRTRSLVTGLRRACICRGMVGIELRPGTEAVKSSHAIVRTPPCNSCSGEALRAPSPAYQTIRAREANDSVGMARVRESSGSGRTRGSAAPCSVAAYGVWGARGAVARKPGSLAWSNRSEVLSRTRPDCITSSTLQIGRAGKTALGERSIQPTGSRKRTATSVSGSSRQTR